jgi:hypothetical protein
VADFSERESEERFYLLILSYFRRPLDWQGFDKAKVSMSRFSDF